MTTTASGMSPAEFLIHDPYDNPGIVGNDDERWEDEGRPRRPPLGVPMPNLVALIREVGGPDAIPDAPDLEVPDGESPARIGPNSPIEDRAESDRSVRLKDKLTERVHVELIRLGSVRLQVTDWHPRREGLVLAFDIPADWATAPWGLPDVRIGDCSSISPDLDRLAAEALDHWIGVIRASGESYITERFATTTATEMTPAESPATGRRYSRIGSACAELARRVAVKRLWPHRPVPPLPLCLWRQADADEGDETGFEQDVDDRMATGSHPGLPPYEKPWWKCRVTLGVACGGADGKCDCPDVPHDCSDSWFRVWIDWCDADGLGQWRSHDIPVGLDAWRGFLATLTDADRAVDDAERPRIRDARAAVAIAAFGDIDQLQAEGAIPQDFADKLRQMHWDDLGRGDAGKER
jgi:hypothetical protein